MAKSLHPSTFESGYRLLHRWYLGSSTELYACPKIVRFVSSSRTFLDLQYPTGQRWTKKKATTTVIRSLEYLSI